MNDPLLAEIAADPARDDARLVWADREGGERGELVVVQCALARGDGDRATRRKLYARERELLEILTTWPEPRGLERPRYERGFITHASVMIDALPKLLAQHPLLTSVELEDARVDIREREPWPDWNETGRRIARVFADLPPGRITKVKANPWIFVDESPFPDVEDHLEDFFGTLSGTHAGRALRGLEVDRPVPLEALAWLDRWSELEELRIGANTFGFVALARFVTLHPRLTRLFLRHVNRQPFDALPRMETFTELDIHGGLDEDDLAKIATLPFPHLRRLGAAWRRGTTTNHGFAALAASETLAHIEALDVSGPDFDDSRLALLARAPMAENLRVLEIRDTSKLTAAAIPHMLAFPKLDRLDLRSSYGDMRVFAPVADVIPWVAR